MLSRGSRLLAPLRSAQQPLQRSMASSAGRVKTAPRLRRPPKDVIQLVRPPARPAERPTSSTAAASCAAACGAPPVPRKVPPPASGKRPATGCVPESVPLLACCRRRTQRSASAPCLRGGKSRTMLWRRCGSASRRAVATDCRTRWTTRQRRRSWRRRSTSTVRQRPRRARPRGTEEDGAHHTLPCVLARRGSGLRGVISADARHRDDNGLCRGASLAAPAPQARWPRPSEEWLTPAPARSCRTI